MDVAISDDFIRKDPTIFTALRFTVLALGYPSFIWPCKAELMLSWQIHCLCFHETSVSLLGWLWSCDTPWRCTHFKSGLCPVEICTCVKQASPHLSVSILLFASSCPPSSPYFSLGACFKSWTLSRTSGLWFPPKPFTWNCLGRHSFHGENVWHRAPVIQKS